MSFLAVIGNGRSGRAAAELAKELNIPTKIIQDREDLTPTQQLVDVHHVIVSPGVNPEKSALMQYALQNDLMIDSELDFAASHFPNPMLAITGTNGKTTTTELTARLLNAGNCPAYEAGNIGTPLSEIALALRQKRIPATSVAVVEVSSFQLEHTSKFSPVAAAILNIKADHLDRYHNSMTEYAQTKYKIFDHVARGNRIFGNSMYCPFEQHFVDKNQGVYFQEKQLFEWKETALSAPHNRENVLTALELVLRLMPITHDMIEALRSYRPGRHRLEEVPGPNGIRCINDSKATNPASVNAAVKALCSDASYPNIHLLLGGLDKNMDFTELKESLPLVKHAYLYGQCRTIIQQAIGMGELFDSFEDAVSTALQTAVPGEIVLLSPSCASMDLFQNYAERGDRFIELVQEFVSNAR